MLYTKLVALIDGLVEPRTLIWNGRRMKAPEMPAMDVNNEMISATNGGRSTEVLTPETGKTTDNISIRAST